MTTALSCASTFLLCFGLGIHLRALTQGLGVANIVYACYAVGYWMLFLAGVMRTDPFGTFFGLVAAYWTWKWWQNRRDGRRRKTLRELGAKSRARVEQLVRQMTPSPIPTPVGAR